MTIVANNLHGDYQLANGYGHDKAKEVLKVNLFPALLFLYHASLALGKSPKRGLECSVEDDYSLQ